MPRRRTTPAVRFLWIVAALTVLTVAGGVLYRVFEADLMRWTMVPKADFRPVPMPAGASYDEARMWLARPDLERNPASWVPREVEPAEEPPRASVFFVHPTSFLEASAWNARIDHGESQARARLFVRSQASAFNAVGEVWAPRYRQAAFGAFLTSEANAARALDFAYRDVLAAFEAFLRQAPQGRPIILAGHSQGSLHLLRLLQERVRGTPVARRIAAAYLPGWPISESADLPGLPLPACDRPDQARCLLSWQSFAEPADPELVTDAFDASVAPNGQPRRGTSMVCVNPVTGTRGGMSPREANVGALVPDAGFRSARFMARRVPARCDARGFLLVGDDGRLPAMGPYVLPGNNYHVYDYALFWANVRADAERRVRAWEGRR